MSATKTPRCDDLFHGGRYVNQAHMITVAHDFARQLERELITMTEAAKQAVMERGYYQARAKELETLLVNTIKTPPSFPC